MKKWYIALLCFLFACSQPAINPVNESIREFYIINKDQLIVSLTSKSDILIEIEPGVDTYYFLLNHKQVFLNYYKENGQHIVIFKGNAYSINEY